MSTVVAKASAPPARVKQPEPLELVRLPWHDDLAARFGDIGVEKSTWKVLAEAVWPSAKTTDSIVMALSYCKARRLDPFKKPVHIVPVYDARANGGEGGYIETVWPSIAEMRTTAFRTGQYAGCDETVFGPTITKSFKGSVKRGGKWTEKTVEVSFPEWAQITVYRLVSGQRVPFVGPKVYWLETYARIGRSEIPNDMWARRTHGQIEKCSEAGSLRKAFPEELGNEYAAEEMEGQRLWHEIRDVTPKAAQTAAFQIPDENDVAAPTAADHPPAAAEPTKQPPPAKQVVNEPIPEDDDGWPGPK